METEKKQAEPFKRCGCGRVYATRDEWATLPDAKIFEGADGALCEQRRCACDSHITATLVPAMSVSDLRRAVRVIDGQRESFNDEYTATEMLRLIQVCWASGWDVTPDEWTAEQCAAALAYGTAPRFEHASGTFDGLHALGVSDCRCRGCRDARRALAEHHEPSGVRDAY